MHTHIVFIHTHIPPTHLSSSQVIRVLRYHVQVHCLDPLIDEDGSDEGSTALRQELRLAAESVISRVVLPASTLVPSNVALASEVRCLASFGSCPFVHQMIISRSRSRLGPSDRVVLFCLIRLSLPSSGVVPRQPLPIRHEVQVLWGAQGSEGAFSLHPWLRTCLV